MCRSLPALPEILDADKAGLPPPTNVKGVIEPTKDAATAFVVSNLDEPPPRTFISFSDGSHHPDKGSGAAAVVYNNPEQEDWPTLSVIVGDADATTPYQVELVGFELAVANARQTAPPGTNFFWFPTDNQTLIKDFTKPLKVKAGILTCLRIRLSLSKLRSRYPNSTAAIIWCPSKSSVKGMKKNDAAAKAAVNL